MYSARCPKPSCGRAFATDNSGSVACPACGTIAVIVLDVGATLDTVPEVPVRGANTSAPRATPAVQSDLAETIDGPCDRPTAADTAFPKSFVPATIGRFRVQNKLGAGMFGDVYRAHDPQLDREVALKVAKPGTLDSPERVGRFLREARAAANLRHPNIVPVFDSGRDGDRHYIASGFINGRTLEAEIEEADGKPLDLNRAATLIRKLAEALGYAHRQGVVHRDVKPANVLVDAAGEPSLTDFGLAVRAGDEAVKTQDGKVLGSPAYMSPEQAAGKSAEATAASDQYALGIMLYEMATGRRPFEGPMELVIFQQIQVEPRRPRSENPAIPKDLETVILKCLEKEPGQRYASCEALAEDLRRFLDGEPVTARRIGPAERFARWARRNPAVAASVSFGVLALVLGTAVSVWQAGEAREQAAVARRAAENESVQKELAETNADEAKTAARRANEEARRANVEAERANGEANRANTEKDRAEEETKKARQQTRRAETASEFMRDLFVASDTTGLTGSGLVPPGEAGRNVTAAELLRRGAQQIADRLKDDPLTRANLMDAIGEVSRNLGLYDQALPLLTEALAIRRRMLTPDHPDVTASVFHLANWHTEKGNFVEAEKLFDEALATHARLGTLDTLAAAEVQMRYAFMLSTISDPRSVAAARAALATREKLLGPKDRDTAICRLVLGMCLLEQDNMREAVPHVSGALAYLKSIGGDQKDGVLAGVLEYQNGVVMSSMGLYSQAEKKYRSALELLSKALGPTHIYLGFFRHELGFVLSLQGKYEEAEGLFKNALESARTTIGIEHPRTLVVLTSYTNLLVARGRPKEAYALAAEALRAVDRRYGKTARWRQQLLLLCAIRAAQAGDRPNGRAHATEALAVVADPAYVPTERNSDSLVELAHTIENLGDLELTGKVFAAALAQEHLIPVNRWRLRHNYGVYLAVAGKYAEAEPHLRAAADLYKNALDIQSGNAAAYTYGLEWQGRTAWALGRFADAEGYFRAAVATARKTDRGNPIAPGGRLIVLVATQRRFADLLPHLETFLELRNLPPTDRAWATYLETSARALGGDQTGAAAALARLEERFGTTTDRDAIQYRARAVWAAGGDDAVRVEIQRLQKAPAVQKYDPALLALAACQLRVNRPADALDTLSKLAPQAGVDPKTTVRDTLKAFAEYRKDPTPGNRTRLLTAVARAEKFIQTFTVTNHEYSWYYTSLVCDVALVCGQIRDELRPVPVAPLPRRVERFLAPEAGE